MVRIELDRTVDRALRDAIDELTRQLTPLGKIELATRLFGEVAAETVDAIVAVLTTQPAGTRIAIEPTHEEPVPIAIERGGEGREEARKPSPASSNVEAVSDDTATITHEEETE